jgi:hypothetical protein
MALESSDVKRCILGVLSLLIDILSFSDDNADQIKVSISASSPDV